MHFFAETSMNDSVLHGALPHFSDALPMSSFINLPVLFDDVHAITVQVQSLSFCFSELWIIV